MTAPMRRRIFSREEKSLRDDRRFLIGCDDTFAPKQYFKFFRFHRVRVYVVSADDRKSAARHTLDRLREIDVEPEDERWLLLDTDHHLGPDHIAGFLRVLQEARQQGVNVALSRPCFELWLLLHYAPESTVAELQNAKQVETRLRQALGGYNKIRLRGEHWPLALAREACERAERLDRAVGGGDIPQGNTSRVYQLWRALEAGITA